MKKLNIMLVVPALLAVHNLFAQEAHLKLSNEHPAAGEKVAMTYDPTGTPV